VKTNVKTTIESQTRQLEFGYWMQEGEEGEFIPLQNEQSYRIAAEHLGCSRELLDMMSLLHDFMLDAIIADLVDIWKRLDRMQQD